MLLDLRGIPANLISLGAIDFGIIVDSSVVIMENLLRILQRAQGQTPLPAARHHRGRRAKWAGPSCFPR